MRARSVPAIALSPSNQSGGYYFMSLYSGQKLHAYEWDKLPIDSDVIARVEQLALAKKQPKLIDGLPLFEWHSKNLMVELTDEVQEDK